MNGTHNHHGNLQTKVNPSYGPIIILTGKSPVYTPRQYEQLAKAAYEKVECVYACVGKIAEAFSGIRWIAYDVTRDKKGKTVRNELDGTHPLQRCLLRPNPGQGQSRFLDEGMRYLCLAGNEYMYRDVPTGKSMMELYNQRPDRIRIVPGNAAQPVAYYEYTVGGQKVMYKPEQILHLKLFHPTNDWYGLSPLEVAAPEVDVLNLSTEWNARILTNDGRPSLIIKTAGSLTDEQYERARERILEKFSGPENVGLPIGPLEGGLEAQIVSFSAKDMDFRNLDKQTRLKIATLYNTPPEMIGDSENKTYSNYQEARRAFYEDNIIPKTRWWRDELNYWLAPLFGESIYIDYDPESIEAIRENRSQLITDRNSQLDRGIITRNEYRAEEGRDPVQGGDVLTVSGSVMPLDAAVGAPEIDAAPEA